MTTQAEITMKLGLGASDDFTDDMQTAACLQAESNVNAVCRYNFSDVYSTLNVDVKYILSDIVSSLVAIQGILYDFSGYPSRTVAEDMINAYRDAILRNLSIIRNKQAQDFINGA